MEDQDDDTRAETAAVIDDLKEQVQKAETVSEQYCKQLGVLQMRLDDAVSDQGKTEDQTQEKDRVIASQQEEIRQLSRRLREVEVAHETELASVLKDKESLVDKEEDLQATIQRLKETIAQKDPRMNVDNERNLSRSCKFSNKLPPGDRRCHLYILIWSQQASGTGQPMAKANNLLRRRNSNGARLETIRSLFYKRTS